MDPSKLNHLRQIEIAMPCSEDWDEMEGDERQRFCAGCGCFVNNISAMGASEAEILLASKGKICTRILVDPKKGILTRDGWIPRLVLAGAFAATVAGCSENRPLTGATVSKSTSAAAPSPQYVSVGLVAPSLSGAFLDEESSNTPEIGWPNIVAEKQPDKALKKSGAKDQAKPKKSGRALIVGMITSPYGDEAPDKKPALSKKKKDK